MIATNAPAGTKVHFLDGIHVLVTTDKPKQDDAGKWFVETQGGNAYPLDCLTRAGKHAKAAPVGEYA